MKKNPGFDVMSDRVCTSPGCQKKIKQRLVNKENLDEVNKKFSLCYSHWKEQDYNRRAVGTKR